MPITEYSDKMGEEKLERAEGEVDEVEVEARRVLWKMDVRFVVPLPFLVSLPASSSVASRLESRATSSLHGNLTTHSILPVLALLFLCSFIDRTNVGNARILGLEKDIGINDHQYAIGLCVFYATYIAR